MNFKSQNNEIYNKDFNLDELVQAIQLSHDSATGPDEIYYQMLKQLPDTSLETLLNILNYIWTTGKFPEDWIYATLIPIPKPGKDPAEPNNYRPIALTSCLCKTLERMINKRLTVSHFSYAPIFQGQHFLKKMLESNILYDNLFIDILSV